MNRPATFGQVAGCAFLVVGCLHPVGWLAIAFAGVMFWAGRRSTNGQRGTPQ